MWNIYSNVKKNAKIQVSIKFIFLHLNKNSSLYCVAPGHWEKFNFVPWFQNQACSKLNTSLTLESNAQKLYNYILSHIFTFYTRIPQVWFKSYFQYHILWRKSKNVAPKPIPSNYFFLKTCSNHCFKISNLYIFSYKYIFSKKIFFKRKHDFSWKLEDGTGLQGVSSNLNIVVWWLWLL